MTPEEMQAKVEALRGVNTIEDWYTKFQPKHTSRYAKPGNDKVAQAIAKAEGMPSTSNGQSGTIMQARYPGKCIDCGEVIRAADTIRYARKRHCYPTRH